MFPKGMLREYSGVLSVVARLLEIFCVFLGGYLAYLWKFGNSNMPPHFQIAILLAVCLVFILFPFFGSSTSKSWRGQSWLTQARVISFAWASVIFTLILIAYFTKTGIRFSREWLIMWAVSTWGLLLLFRFSLTYFLRVIRASGLNKKRIVIVGAGALGKRVAKGLMDTEWSGLHLVGFIDDDECLHGTRIGGVKVRGSVDKLAILAERGHIDEVWLALPLRAEQRVKEVLHQLRHSTATVRFVPNIFELRLLNHSFVEVAGLPVLNLSESPMYGMNRVVKFLEDKLIAGGILLLISPLMIAIAIGVKLSSPGPVFYRQKRVSWNSKSFMMLKFRTMPTDCEVQTGAVWAKKGECRATRFGSFLRRTSLDELPQFIDVLKGNMSIVGPRPERPVFVDKFKDEIPDYMKKHMVKAGITGWAQVNGWRGDTDLKTRIEYDLYYIEHWSLWLDIKIIIRTLFSGFVHKNAY